MTGTIGVCVSARREVCRGGSQGSGPPRSWERRANRGAELRLDVRPILPRSRVFFGATTSQILGQAQTIESPSFALRIYKCVCVCVCVCVFVCVCCV